jgi:cardiolipin synthase
VGAALTRRRVLGPADANVLAVAAVVLIAVAVVGIVWPWVLAVPLAAVTGWVGTVMGLRALRLWRGRKGGTPGRTEP